MAWYDVERNATWKAVQRAKDFVELCLTGKKPMQMICSVPGIGKSELVLELLAKHGHKPYYFSPSSEEGFCADLWANRDKPYFLDDCDVLATHRKIIGIAKMAYGPQRTVIVPNTLSIQRNERRRLDGSEKYDENIPPPTFKMEQGSALIWCANTNFTDPANLGDNVARDFAALVSRGLDAIWIPGSDQEVFNYTIWMIVESGMLRRNPQARLNEGGFKLAHQQEVLDFFCRYANQLLEVNPRMAWRLADARKKHGPAYIDYWKAQLSDRYLRAINPPDVVPQLLSPAMKRDGAPPRATFDWSKPTATEVAEAKTEVEAIFAAAKKRDDAAARKARKEAGEPEPEQTTKSKLSSDEIRNIVAAVKTKKVTVH